MSETLEAIDFDTDTVLLGMSRDQAELLAVVLARVAGGPHNSPRKHSDAVLTKLMGMGISWQDNSTRALLDKEPSVSLYFNDYPQETP